jgi:autoinducer 2 (AI-2) kinase
LNPLTLTIDISTGGIHVCLINESLEIIFENYRELEYSRSEVPGAKEIDTEELWETLIEMIRRTHSEVGILNEVSKISVTSQREGCVFLDNNDRVLLACPNIDSRASEIARSLPLDTKKEIYNITGHWPDCYFPAMRLLWFRQEVPSLFEKISRFMMLNEWVVYKLLGKSSSESVCEKTNAAESMLFDVRENAWSDRLIDMLDLSHLQFSRIVEPGTISGSIDSTLSSILRIPGNAEIKIAMADTQSAVLGSGSSEPGDIVIINGSTTPIQMIMDYPLVDRMHRTWTCPYLDNLWTLESNCRKTGLMYRRIRNDLQQFMSQIDESLFLGSNKLDKIIAMAARDSHDTLAFLGPGIFDVSSGKNHPYSISFSDDRVNIFSSVLVGYIENLSFAVRANIEQLEEISERRAKRIILTGGASRNSLLRSILPTLLKESSLFVTENLDTTSIGASVIGRERETKIKEILLSSVRKLPVSENDSDFYEKKYHIWKDWYSNTISRTRMEEWQ